METKWHDFVKAAQPAAYGRTGGMAGMAAGTALAAILSYLHYSKQKKDSVLKRILKGLAWTGLGAASGGAFGYGIGKLYGSNAEFYKALESAKKKNDHAKNLGVSDGNGRVLLVNFPRNMSDLNDDDLKYLLPSWVSQKNRARLRKILPKEVETQHAAILTMNNDGSNARLMGIGDSSPDESKSYFNEMAESGKLFRDDAMKRSGEDGLKNGLTRAEQRVVDFKDRLKGKSDDEIAKIIAGYGKVHGYGDEVDMYEGEKNVDIGLARQFWNDHNYIAHGSGHTGYGISPGSYNCGTAARATFDSVQPFWSHLLDMAWGGRPVANMPAMAKKTHARSGT